MKSKILFFIIASALLAMLTVGCKQDVTSDPAPATVAVEYAVIDTTFKTFTVTFDENVGAVSTATLATAVTVTKDGTAVNLAAGTPVVVTGSNMTIMLAAAIADNTDTDYVINIPAGTVASTTSSKQNAIVAKTVIVNTSNLRVVTSENLVAALALSIAKVTLVAPITLSAPATIKDGDILVTSATNYLTIPDATNILTIQGTLTNVAGSVKGSTAASKIVVTADGKVSLADGLTPTESISVAVNYTWIDADNGWLLNVLLGANFPKVATLVGVTNILVTASPTVAEDLTVAATAKIVLAANVAITIASEKAVIFPEGSSLTIPEADFVAIIMLAGTGTGANATQLVATGATVTVGEGVKVNVGNYGDVTAFDGLDIVGTADSVTTKTKSANGWT